MKSIKSKDNRVITSINNQFSLVEESMIAEDIQTAAPIDRDHPLVQTAHII